MGNELAFVKFKVTSMYVHADVQQPNQTHIVRFQKPRGTDYTADETNYRILSALLV